MPGNVPPEPPEEPQPCPAALEFSPEGLCPAPALQNYRQSGHCTVATCSSGNTQLTHDPSAPSRPVAHTADDSDRQGPGRLAPSRTPCLLTSLPSSRTGRLPLLGPSMPSLPCGHVTSGSLWPGPPREPRGVSGFL